MTTTTTGTITLSIDGQEITAKRGMTVLEVAQQAEIYVPTLCYHPDLAPYGACRLCIVEIEKMRGLPTACTTPANDGMVVQTNSPQIQQYRRGVLELMLSEHPHPCLTCWRRERCGPFDICLRNVDVTQRCVLCPNNGICELQEVVDYIGIEEVNLPSTLREAPIDDENPFFERDYNLCILCGRCVRVCQEVRGVGAIACTSRGSETLPGTAFGHLLRDSDCKYCGACVDVCPTGALIERSRKWEGAPDSRVATTCPYCGVGCQLELGMKDGQIMEVLPLRDNDVNRGQACVKGRFGIAEVVHHPDRLTGPLVKQDGAFREASWDEVLDLVASRLSGFKKEEVGVVSSAKCTNEDNYVVQKFTRTAFGHNNVDHCARLCHSPTVLGLVTTLGGGAMTNDIQGIGNAACILAIGTNTTEAHPVISLEMKKAVRNGGRLIVANTREIDLVAVADIWLRHRPGTDVALLMGMARVIVDEGLHDAAFIEERCEDFDAFKKSLEGFGLDTVAEITGVPAEKIAEAARMYAQNSPAAIFYAVGITQHTHGTDNVIATANLAMLTGNVGKPSSGVNPLRGQNNVQGACDLGALPDVYTGYQSVADPAIKEKFEKAWGAELSDNPGLTVVDMFAAAGKGEIRAMYVMGENPPLSEPDATHAIEVLKKLDFLVVQDIFMSETAELADVVLPAASFAEKDGTFTNTERRVQRVRKALDPPGDARPDWLITSQIAQRMGLKGFEFADASAVMDEIASLTPGYGGISYERIEGGGLQWPCPDKEHPGTAILHTAQFTRGKGHFVPLEYKESAELPDDEYPLLRTTGRSQYHFHTGTMTRKVAGLNDLLGESMIDINPADAEKLGVTHGDQVAVTSRRGSVTARANVTEVSAEGVVYMNFHFAESSANVLTNPVFDPVAKTPEYKVCAVRIEKST